MDESLIEPSGLDLKQIKNDIKRGIHECFSRGLQATVKWLSEIKLSLRSVESGEITIVSDEPIMSEEDLDNYDMARILFDLKEFDRCAYFCSTSEHPKMIFFNHFAQYNAIVKKSLDDMVEISAAITAGSTELDSLRELLTTLNKIVYGNVSSLNTSCPVQTKDPFILFLHGLVLKRLRLRQQALEKFVQSINLEPMNWSAWMELSQLIQDKAVLDELQLPDHWIKQFFLGYMYIELQMNDEALEIYDRLRHGGFKKNSYIKAQIAIAYHNRREVDLAIDLFRELTADDPFRLDNMDTYSNLLYVKDMRPELSHLAHHTCEVDKYRPETCVVIANFYSLRGDHNKAAQSFHRALRLQPNFLTAWTLMGHEFMELKNTNAAMKCYRQAVEVNWHDYRAWYGLGQAYEILKMNQFSQYHYKRAQALRPNDSRMLIALGEANEKVNKKLDALKCYYKARYVGDIEKTALLKMAKLYESMNRRKHAATVYHEFVVESQKLIEGDNGNVVCSDRGEVAFAYRFLANFYNDNDDLDKAHAYANKCLEFDETKEEAKSLLRSISQKRAKADIENDTELKTPAARILRPARLQLNEVTPVGSGTSNNNISSDELSTPQPPPPMEDSSLLQSINDDMSLATDNDETPMVLSP